jgi:hypothetical protein
VCDIGPDNFDGHGISDLTDNVYCFFCMMVNKWNCSGNAIDC